jgi:hypothetical protein
LGDPGIHFPALEIVIFSVGQAIELMKTQKAYCTLVQPLT